jgi:serine/threonine protein kinase
VTDRLESVRTALEDRYAVERLLGQGGMATVYLARDSRHDRNVAIKVLRHPNILALHDSGEAGSFLYYVMPLPHRLSSTVPSPS